MSFEKIFKNFRTKITSEIFLAFKELFKTKNEKNIRVPVPQVENILFKIKNTNLQESEYFLAMLPNFLLNSNLPKDTYDEINLLKKKTMDYIQLYIELILDAHKNKLLQILSAYEMNDLFILVQNMNDNLSSSLENDKLALFSKFENIISNLDNQKISSYEKIIYFIDEIKSVFNSKFDDILKLHIEILNQQINFLNLNNILSSKNLYVNNKISIQKIDNEKIHTEDISNNEISVQKVNIECLSNNEISIKKILNEIISVKKISNNKIFEEEEKELNKNIFNNKIFSKNINSEDVLSNKYYQILFSTSLIDNKLFYHYSHTKNNTLICINKNIIYLQIRSFHFHIPIK